MIFWPHIGIAGDFEPCEENILAALNRNFLLLDSILQMKAIDFVETIPLNPNAGDIYILEEESYGYSYHKNSILIYAGDHWIHVEPSLGFIAAVESENALFWFNGTDWVLLPTTVGDVSGPISSLKNSVARFDSTDGKWITGSGVILDDDDSMTGISSVYSDSVYAGFSLADRSRTGDAIVNSFWGINHVVTESPAKSIKLGGVFNTVLSAIAEVDSLVLPSPLAFSALFSIENKSGSRILFKNNSLIVTGSNGDLSLPDGATLIAVYSEETETFNVISGGGGGGAIVPHDTQSLGGAAVISIAPYEARQRIKIKSTGGTSTVTLPNGTVDGQEVFVQGMDDVDYCRIVNGGNVVQNGDLYFTLNKVAHYVWDSGQTKWIQVGGTI